VDDFIGPRKVRRANGPMDMWANSAHLPQTHGHATPALDLDVHIIPDPLPRAKQVPKVDFHTTTTFTPHTRQLDGHFTP